MNNNISEKYRKYLIKVFLSSGEYLTVSGIDPQIGDDDVFLSDNKKVLLFSSLEELKIYLCDLNNDQIFDSNIIRKWIKELDNKEPYAEYNFIDQERVLKKWSNSPEINETNNQELKGFLDVMGFAQDLMNQFSNEEIKTILELEEIDKFYDSLYDSCVWISDDTFKLSRDLSNNLKSDFLAGKLKDLLREISLMFLIVK